LIIVTQRITKPPPNAEPLIVGGLDFTDIPEFKDLVTMKNYEFVSNAPLPSSAMGQLGQREKEGEIDLRAKFKEPLEQIKNMGFEDEEMVLSALLASNGNINQAL
jgi:hypothetical protein